MFERINERRRQQEEERERQIREERERLLSLSEKELLLEILMELRQIERRIDSVEYAVDRVKRTVRLYSD